MLARTRSMWGLCFNSLQTGKAFRTSCRKRSTENYYWFQFPSNGKGFPNLAEVRCCRVRIADFVSIPFKRERLSEQNTELTTSQIEELSFNSLQTGKAFRTLAEKEGKEPQSEFQFPSNGKGFPNQQL